MTEQSISPPTSREKNRPITVGERHGRLTVVGRGELDYRGRKKVQVRCDCGVVKSVGSSEFRTTHSCGCYSRDVAPFRNLRHGHTGTPVYSTWLGMILRCEKLTDPSYGRYGARGITVCEAWHKFENFFADMGERPEGKTLDRIDGQGNYEPGNCRWATSTEQNRNRKNNRRYSMNGESRTVVEWAELFKINANTLTARLQRDGMTLEDALRKPIAKRGWRNWKP